jgi:ABC-type multidrug transport system ATPase subunit
MSAEATADRDAEPTIELEQLVVRSASAAWTAPLSLRSQARRVGLIGDFQPLFQVLEGRAELAGGRASVCGCELETAISSGVLGFSACDVSLPDAFTVTEYLQHAARLSHGSRSRAAHDAQRALERYGLGALAQRRLAGLALYQRRALGIALSTLTAPAVVCLEAPLRGLDAPSADYIARLCLEASAHGRVLLSADLPSAAGPERSLLDTCDELFVLERGNLVAQGAPSSVWKIGPRYSLRVKGARIPAYAEALAGAGVRVEALAETGRFDVELPAPGGEGPDLLLDAALDHGLIVLSLEPLFVL